MSEMKLNLLNAVKLQWDIGTENLGLDSWLTSSLTALTVICSKFDSVSESFIR